MMRRVEQAGLVWFEADLPGGVQAVFTTRHGGVSRPPHDSLNLGLHSGDQPDPVGENRRRLCAALNLDPARVRFARQVHGANVESHAGPTSSAPSDRQERPEFTAQRDPAQAGLPAADGQHVCDPTLVPLVLVADCLPVALAGPGGTAMLHCGWRPMAAGIIDAGVRRCQAESAVIGPGIGPCCYEVGEEVIQSFAELGPQVNNSRHLDLAAVAERLLIRAGVTNILRSELCTACEPGLFYSHRRDGALTGRQAGLIWGKMGGNG